MIVSQYKKGVTVPYAKKMPVYERKKTIYWLAKEAKEQQERMEKASQKNGR